MGVSMMVCMPYYTSETYKHNTVIWGDTPPALREKGAAGIGVLKECRGKAANHRSFAAFSFVPLFWRLGQGAARPPGFREVPRYANLFEPLP